MSSVIEQFQSLISQAAASKQTLRIQGGNSKYFYGQAARSDAVLDTRAHTGIVSYEPSELVVTVRCGHAFGRVGSGAQWARPMLGV
jgi:glycolate oxidase FAD binding subunit